MSEASYQSRMLAIDAVLSRGAALARLEGASASLCWQVARVQTTLQNHCIELRALDWPDSARDLARTDAAISEATGSLAYLEQLVKREGPGVKGPAF